MGIKISKIIDFVEIFISWKLICTVIHDILTAVGIFSSIYTIVYTETCNYASICASMYASGVAMSLSCCMCWYKLESVVLTKPNQFYAIFNVCHLNQNF